VIDALNIRSAMVSDASEIAALIQSLAGYFIAEPGGSGSEAFFATMSRQSVEGYIVNPGFFYLVALIGLRLVGVAALRDNKHVYHLFFHPEYHRHGIARSLWTTLKEKALNRGSNGFFTVNSSLFAVPACASFGFFADGAPQVRNGIRYQPMQLAPAH
jgi:GNAT superfamily N-acetyltransferase